MSVVLGGNGSVGRGMSTGSLALIVLFGGVVAPYLAIGAALQHRRGERGHNLLPHRAFWAEVPGLVALGCRTTFGCVAKRTGFLSANLDYDRL